MADLKVTKMVIKVDLQCCKCYKKIKKVLCRYPEIRDQVYDEKKNTVTITVVCCSPECIRDKIICKAGDTVESIEILPEKPPKPPAPAPAPAAKPPAPAPAPAPAAKPPAPAPAPAPAAKPPAPAPAPAPAPKPPAPAPAPAPAPKPPAPAPAPAPAPKPPAPAPAPAPPPKVPEPAPIPPPVQGFPQPPPPGPVPMYPIGVCCCCYKGDPCYCRRGPMCDDGCGRPAYDCNRGYYVSRCDEYFSEENATGCSVM